LGGEGRCLATVRIDQTLYNEGTPFETRKKGRRRITAEKTTTALIEPKLADKSTAKNSADKKSKNKRLV